MNMGGRPEDYDEEYHKKLKAKHTEYLKNKLYISWVNANGKICKTILNSSRCFCNHR